jgi:hypothetical protein
MGWMEWCLMLRCRIKHIYQGMERRLRFRDRDKRKAQGRGRWEVARREWRSGRLGIRFILVKGVKWGRVSLKDKVRRRGRDMVRSMDKDRDTVDMAVSIRMGFRNEPGDHFGRTEVDLSDVALSGVEIESVIADWTGIHREN